MVDLGDLVTKAKDLLPETADKVLAALDEAVLYKINGIYREKAADNVYLYFVHYSIGDEIPEEAVNDLEDINYEDIITVEGFNDKMPVTITDENYARLTLKTESLDAVKSVFFNLAYYSEEDDTVLFLGTDNDLTADWDKGFFRIILEVYGARWRAASVIWKLHTRSQKRNGQREYNGR